MYLFISRGIQLQKQFGQERLQRKIFKMQGVPGSNPTRGIVMGAFFCCSQGLENLFWTHLDLKYMAKFSMQNPDCKTFYVNWTSF